VVRDLQQAVASRVETRTCTLRHPAVPVGSREAEPSQRLLSRRHTAAHPAAHAVPPLTGSPPRCLNTRIYEQGSALLRGIRTFITPPITFSRPKGTKGRHIVLSIRSRSSRLQGCRPDGGTNRHTSSGFDRLGRLPRDQRPATIS